MNGSDRHAKRGDDLHRSEVGDEQTGWRAVRLSGSHRRRPLAAALLAVVVACGGAVAIAAAASSAGSPSSAAASASAASAKRYPRKVVLRGTGQAGIRYTAVARRKTRTRWCIRLELSRTVDETGQVNGYDGRRICGTIRREGAVALTLACPYGAAVAGIADGRPKRIEYVAKDGTVSRLKTRNVRDRSGPGTLWVAAAAAENAPGRVVVRNGDRSRTVADVQDLGPYCG